jgi:hypothetical protein
MPTLADSYTVSFQSRQAGARMAEIEVAANIIDWGGILRVKDCAWR